MSIMELVDAISQRNVLNKGSLTFSPSRSSPARNKLPASGMHRIYRAPQASVRATEQKALDKHKIGSTRRRRRDAVGRSSPSKEAGTGFSLEKSAKPLESLEKLEAPCLWLADADEVGASERGNEIHWRRSPRQRRPSRSLVIRQGNDDVSEIIDGDDTHYSSMDNPPFDRKKKSHYHTLLNIQNILQFIVCIVFCMMIFDSHHKVRKHKLQLKQYDEERAHILEQMMWIDQAAKKVHKKYAQKDLWEDINGDELLQRTKDELREQTGELRDEVKKLQLRIQLNARDRIEKRFGGRPMQVSLSLDPEGQQHLVLALSDDTPHAVSIFLEQIDRKMWDDIELQKLESGALQLSTNLPATTPTIEFIEASRSCHEIGSVVVRQLEAETMDISVLVLRIHMEENTPTDEEDICIGKLINGFGYLEQLEGIPQILDSQK